MNPVAHGAGAMMPVRQSQVVSGIGWITWMILTRDHNSISWFFMQQSIPPGGGSNVVNVILVDFRGFDTFGEITVLGIAAIGALCLMDGMRRRMAPP